MKRLLAMAVAVASFSSLSACVVGHRRDTAGNITFTWTFNRQTCAQVPDVVGVVIAIPGQELQNNGAYACTTAGYDGIQLNDFVGGAYSFTLNAVDVGGTVLYTQSGTFTVDGDVTVAVDLNRVALQSEAASLTWSFPPDALSQNPTCQDESIPNVDVSIDGTHVATVDCTVGQTTGGWVSPQLSLGSHSITLSGISTTGQTFFSATGTIDVAVSQANAFALPFQWAVGAVDVGWNLYTHSNILTDCATMGESQVNIQLYDPQNAPYFTQPGLTVACDSGGSTTYVGSSWVYADPGSYTLVLSTPDGVYVSQDLAVDISAGSFPSTLTVVPVTHL